MFDGANMFGKEFIDTSVKSFASLSQAAQAIVAETSDYTRRSYEAGAATLEQLAAARSLETAFEIQTDYARKAYEGFVAESAKLSSLYADMAKEAYKPFESMVAKPK
jgi:hypothetical protein